MKIESQEINKNVYVVTVGGEVDMNSSPEVRKTLLPLFMDSTKLIVVDLSQVSYIDSSGIATLIEGLQKGQKGATLFRLAGLSQTVKAAFELAHLDNVFDIYRDQVEALKGIS